VEGAVSSSKNALVLFTVKRVINFERIKIASNLIFYIPKYLQSETPPSHLPAYRWSILFMFTSPFYVFLTDWTPVGLVFAYSLISLVTLPVMVALLFVLTADPRRMGDQANSLFTNLVLLGTIGFSIYVAWQGYVELSQNHM